MLSQNSLESAASKHYQVISDVDIYEINNQLIWLEENIADALAQFRLLSGEIESMEGDLKIFMTSYYSEVGALYDELLVVNAQMRSQNNDAVVLVESECDYDDLQFSYISEEQGKNADNEIKRTYHRLAKILHPDVSQSDMRSAKIFKELSESYLNNDLSGMIKIEQLYCSEAQKVDESSVVKLERLERQHDKLLNDIDKFKIRKNEIANSKDYKLQQRVCWHKMCGEDLVDEIKQKISKEIAVKKQVLSLSSN